MKCGLFIYALALFASANVYAGPCAGLYATYRDYREMPVGAECTTSQGTIFRRVSIHGELGMQDMSPDGKVWFDSKKEYWHSQTTEKCALKGQVVPSKEDFSKALDRGLQQAFADWNYRSDMDTRFFWTSTTYAPDETRIVVVKIDYWQIFFGDWPKNSTVALSLRCVSGP